MGDVSHLLLLAVTGLAAGLAGAVTGVASLVVYPGLLAFGLTPVAANVTSTVANVFGGLGSAAGSRPELVGQAARVRRLSALAAVGAVAGAALLLSTPSSIFAGVVPAFIAVASFAIFVRPHPTRTRLVAPDADGLVLALGTFALGVYAGYFGAAAGTVLLVLLLYVTGESIPRATGVKNVTFMFANAVAAVAFGVFGPVSWATVWPLSVGFLIGGRLGPPVMRRLPIRVLRPLIAACGLALAVRLAVSAWG